MKKLFKNLTKRLTLLILAALLIGGPILYLLSLNSNSVKAAWFDDNWAYRKAVTITVASSSSDSTSVNTLIPIDTSTLITAGKLQSACQDLRFTNASGKLLTYYIDASCNTTTTEVVVQIDLVPKNTTTYTLYMYYGNPSASSASNSSLSGVFNSLSQGLTGYWAMNESSWSGTTSEVRDFSGNGYHGTSVNSASITSSGKYGNAGSFNGSSNYASISSTPITSLSAWTISAWVKPASINQNGIVYYNRTGGMGFGIGGSAAGETTGNTLRGIYDGVAWLITTYTFTDTTTWHHVVMQRSGGTTTFYVDGTVLSGTTNSTSTPTGSSTGASIGRDNFSRYFNGTIDDVRTYNRALSSTEITNLYNNPGTIATSGTASAGTTPTFASEETTPGPIAWWQLDEGTGTTAQDSTQQNNDGTISGATWQTEDQCIAGKCLYFDGSNDVVTVSNTVSGIQTVSLWIRPTTTSEQIIDINGTASISVSSGTISATSFTSPTIYVNGKVSSTLTANTWQFVTVTTGTALSGSAIKVGQISSNYGQIFVDELKMYGYARSSAQVLTDYNSRGGGEGSSATLSQNEQNNPGAFSQGLVGYWKMDESTANSCSGGVNDSCDSSGNGIDGAWNGNTANTTGKYGNGTSYDGTGDYISLGDTSTLEFERTSPFTTSTWVKRGATGAVYMILSKQKNVSPVNGWSVFFNTNNTIKFSLRNTINTNDISVSTNNTFTSTSNWYHIVTTYDGSSSASGVKFYVNGVQEPTTTNVDNLSATAIASTEAANIGIRENTGLPFNGRIDETRIYNRALSPADVSALYDFAPRPVGYWNMDENTGSSAFDTSGNANTGTWNGTLGSQWKPGKYGAGGSFDGSSNYISVNSSTPLNITNDITFEAWVYPTNLTGTDYANLGEYNDGVNLGVHFYITGSSPAANNNSRSLFVNYLDTGGTGHQYIGPENIITENAWNHIVFIRSGSTVAAYVNGLSASQTVRSGSTAISTESLQASYALYFGKRISEASPYYLKGNLDDVRIYNYARTSKQIVSDMNAGHPAVGSPVGSALGHWKFDEGYGTAANNSGNGGSALNGTLTNMASPATSTSGWTNSGKFGKALIFDGTNDYVDIGSKTALQVTGDLSIGGWIYINTAVDNGGIITTGASGSETQANNATYAMYLSTGSGNDIRYIHEYSTGSNEDTTFNANLSASTWYHVLLVRNTIDKTVKLYVNGVQTGSTFTYTNNPDGGTTNSLNIGRDINSSTYFNGNIDEPKIYNYALTADQVKIDYNRGQAQVLGALSDNTSAGSVQASSQEYCIPGDTTTCTAPIGEWRFEENKGTSVADTSGNSHTGTWSGTAQWAPGKFGSGGKFNGSSSISLTTPSSFGLSSASVSFWVNGPDASGTVFSIGGIPASDIKIGIDSDDTLSNELVSLRRVNDDNSGSDAIGYTSTNRKELFDGKWHFVVVTFSGSAGGTKIYIDGVSKTVGVGVGSDTGKFLGFNGGTAPTAANIGTYGVGSGGSTALANKTIIDQVRFYNYVRTPAQVAWDYNKGAPVGHWKFDECQGDRANDSSGNGNNGTITVGASGTYTSLGTCTSSSASTMWYNGATGKYNGSLAFDATDDQVIISNSSTVDLTNNTLTLSAWVKWSGGGSQNYIIDKNSNKYNLAIGAAGAGRVRFYVGGTALDSPNAISSGVWHHLVGTNDGSTNRLYIDGIQVNSNSRTPSISAGGNLIIGCYSTCNSTYSFDGQIDDVKIYNYALTATQVKTLYNQGGAVRFGPSTGSP